MVYGGKASSKRTAVYRLFKSNGINTIPQEKKEQAKKFKEYSPRYLHLDVIYLPKTNGIKTLPLCCYRQGYKVMYYRIYDNKTSINTKEFILVAMEFLPFNITQILTDNGLNTRATLELNVIKLRKNQ